MQLLNRYRVKGSSISESVLAMAIIATCLSIAIFTFSLVMRTDSNISFYKGQQKVKELLLKTKLEKSLEDEIYSFETFQIHKRVETLASKTSFKIQFIIRISNQKKEYNYIVSF